MRVGGRVKYETCLHFGLEAKQKTTEKKKKKIEKWLKTQSKIKQASHGCMLSACRVIWF